MAKMKYQSSLIGQGSMVIKVGSIPTLPFVAERVSPVLRVFLHETRTIEYTQTLLPKAYSLYQSATSF